MNIMWETRQIGKLQSPTQGPFVIVEVKDLPFNDCGNRKGRVQRESQHSLHPSLPPRIQLRMRMP